MAKNWQQTIEDAEEAELAKQATEIPIPLIKQQIPTSVDTDLKRQILADGLPTANMDRLRDSVISGDTSLVVDTSKIIDAPKVEVPDKIIDAPKVVKSSKISKVAEKPKKEAPALEKVTKEDFLKFETFIPNPGNIKGNEVDRSSPVLLNKANLEFLKTIQFKHDVRKSAIVNHMINIIRLYYKS